MNVPKYGDLTAKCGEESGIALVNQSRYFPVLFEEVPKSVSLPNKRASLFQNGTSTFICDLCTYWKEQLAATIDDEVKIDLTMQQLRAQWNVAPCYTKVLNGLTVNKGDQSDTPILNNTSSVVNKFQNWRVKFLGKLCNNAANFNLDAATKGALSNHCTLLLAKHFTETFWTPAGQKTPYLTVRNLYYQNFNCSNLAKQDSFQSSPNPRILIGTTWGLHANDGLYLKVFIPWGDGKMLLLKYDLTELIRSHEEVLKNKICALILRAVVALKSTICAPHHTWHNPQAPKLHHYVNAGVLCRAMPKMMGAKVSSCYFEGNISTGRTAEWENGDHVPVRNTELSKREVPQYLVLVSARNETVIKLASAKGMDEHLGPSGPVQWRRYNRNGRLVGRLLKELVRNLFCTRDLSSFKTLYTASPDVADSWFGVTSLGVQCTGEQPHSAAPYMALRSLPGRSANRKLAELRNGVVDSRSSSDEKEDCRKTQRSEGQTKLLRAEKCRVRSDDKALFKPSYCVRYRMCFCTLDCTCTCSMRFRDSGVANLSLFKSVGDNRCKNSSSSSVNFESRLQECYSLDSASSDCNAEGHDYDYDFSEQSNVPSIVLIPSSNSCTPPSLYGKRGYGIRNNNVALRGSMVSNSKFGRAIVNNNYFTASRMVSRRRGGHYYAKKTGVKGGRGRWSGTQLNERKAKRTSGCNRKSTKLSGILHRKAVKRKASEKNIAHDALEDKPVQGDSLAGSEIKFPSELDAVTVTFEHVTNDRSDKTTNEIGRQGNVLLGVSDLNLANKTSLAHPAAKECPLRNGKTFFHDGTLMAQSEDRRLLADNWQIGGQYILCSANNAFSSHLLNDSRNVFDAVGGQQSVHACANRDTWYSSGNAVGYGSALEGQDHTGDVINGMGNRLMTQGSHGGLVTRLQPNFVNQSDLRRASDDQASPNNAHCLPAASVAKMVCDSLSSRKRKSSVEGGKDDEAKFPRLDLVHIRPNAGIVVVEENTITPITPTTECNTDGANGTSTARDDAVVQLRTVGSKRPRVDCSPSSKDAKIPVLRVDEIVPKRKEEGDQDERGMRTRSNAAPRREAAGTQHAVKTSSVTDKKALRQVSPRKLRSFNKQSKALTAAAKAIVRKLTIVKKTQNPIALSESVNADTPIETRLSRRLKTGIKSESDSVIETNKKSLKTLPLPDCKDHGFWKFYRKHQNTVSAKNLILEQRYIKLLLSKEAASPTSKLSSDICALSAVPRDSVFAVVPDDGLMPYVKRLTKPRKKVPPLPQVSDNYCAYCGRSFVDQDRQVFEGHLARHGIPYAVLAAPRSPKKKKISPVKKKLKTSSENTVVESSSDTSTKDGPAVSPSNSPDQVVSPFPRPVHLSMGHRKHTARKSFSITSTLPKDILIAALECKMRAQSNLPASNATKVPSVAPVVINGVVNSKLDNVQILAQSEDESTAVKQPYLPNSARKTLAGLPSSYHHQCNRVTSGMSTFKSPACKNNA